MIVCGEYNPFGYTVIDGKTGEVLFSAGNHKSRKRRTVDPSNSNAVIVSLLRRYCAKKTREVANQRHANYGGVRRAEVPGRLKARPVRHTR